MSLKCILQGQDSKNLVTKVELNEHIADKNNPHKVTAEQVGALSKEVTDLPDGTDFNNIVNTGLYKVFTGINAPIGGVGNYKAFMVLVASEAVSEPRLTQLAISYYQKEQSNRIFIRTIRDEWSDWRELSSTDQLCNPNLLDNWYFGNPINQRNGYIIPAGVEYNDLSWNHAGTTDKAYPVVGYSGRDPLITINGTNYIVGVAAQVPGYCMPGYTIDRWKSDGDTITITANSLKIDSTSKTHLFLQPIEEKLHRLLANKTVTFSVLSDNKNMDGWYITDVNGFATEHNDVRFDGNLATFTFTVADFKSLSSVGIFSGKEDISISLIAAKLELGDTQTLAHKEGDTWVLNEIPDFGEQLRRCQRYCRIIGGTLNNPICMSVRRESTILEGYIPFDFPMRTAPSVSITGAFSTIPNFLGIGFTSQDTISPEGCTLFFKQHNNAPFADTAYLIYAPADTRITFSADL